MKRLSCSTQDATLSFYTSLPVQNLNYEVFKKKAMERLKILRRTEANVGDLSSIGSMDDDLIGHACLKLVCAQNRWASVWFINTEAKLFKARLEKDLFTTKQFFEERFWPHISDHSGSVGAVNSSSTFDPTAVNLSPPPTNILVHFSKCSDLIPKRVYELHKGYLTLNTDVMKAWMVYEFRRFVEKKTFALNSQFFISPDERFEKLVNELFTDSEPASGTSKDAIQKEVLYPLCMQGLLDKFRKEKHLKYNDRQALCLFLKDIGVPLQDTVNLFKTHFNVSLEQFNKDYLYSIRHNYGQEGRKISYRSFTCSKLIGLASDANSFGCPFVKNKEFVKQHIDIEDIGRDVQSCCSRVGAKYAGRELDGLFASPAEYFRLSEKAATPKE